LNFFFEEVETEEQEKVLIDKGASIIKFDANVSFSSYKNKEIALAFSILIPASGKYYLKQNADATSGLLLTCLFGGLAYSAFYKSGVSSVFAWINCAAFGVLYVGNILGTASAVNRFNNKINIEIKNAIKDKLQSIMAM
jgi:hypothetical protein